MRGIGREPKRVYLHVGLPKTGTTFLQGVLATNASRLREHGLLYPLEHREAMFHAAVDLRGSYDRWGFDERRVSGAWDRLAAQVRQFDGSALISHEILSSAPSEQVSKALADIGDAEPHVVLTVRDLGRQIAAYWQEEVKDGRVITFAEFLGRIRDDLNAGKFRAAFWRSEHPIQVLRRWADGLPPGNVHVVVAPPPGADRDELWRRYADAVGIDAAACSTETGLPANVSLGAAQSALLRDVNEALDGRIVRPPYTYVVKRFFAQSVLTQQKAPRLTIPADVYEPARALSETWVHKIEAAGYTVHGDLAELLPVPPPGDAPPVEVAVEDRYAAATDAIAELLVEITRLRENRLVPLEGLRGSLPPLVRRIIDRVR